MAGKLIGIVIVVSALVAGAALYYLQIYGFYTEISDQDAPPVELVSRATQSPERISYSALKAIDADSSPIRFRACFSTDLTPATLEKTYTKSEADEPRNAPKWFDCFDAAAIAEELNAGTATAFLGQKNIHFGVDRIVAITQDGRGYIWHELNDCGEKAYDGTIVGEECPKRE